MRIAIFSNTYLPTISGVVRSIYSYKAALEELGNEVHVFTQGAQGYQDKEKNIHRYPSFEIGLPNRLPITVPYSAMIDRILRDFHPEVIHSQHPILLGNVAVRKARELRVPLVYTLHAQYWTYGVYLPILRKPYEQFIIKRVTQYLKNCDQIIAPSKDMRSMIRDEFKIRKPVTVIPTGVDLNLYLRFSRAEVRKELGWGEDFVILSAGRLAPEKNWTDLIRAAAQVIRKKPGTRLVLLGDGPQRKALELLTRELGVADKIEFVGMVPYEDVAKYMVAADLYAFTSLTETQGLGTLEAMAAGLSVAAYDAIGTRDLVHNGENGILTEPDSDLLALGIIQLIEKPDFRKKLGKGALDTARRLDIRSLAMELLGVYENSIGKTAAH